MRKQLLAAIAIVALLAPAQGEADQIEKRRLRFVAPLACTATCAYWVDILNDLEAPGVKFNECRHPFPRGSYDDVVIEAPQGARLMEFMAWPRVDWDIFVCSKPEKGRNGNTLETGANEATDCQVACIEKIEMPVDPGVSYVLRAYNWSDPAPLRARVRFFG